MAENFDLIFGSSASQSYSWNDSDYQNGWQTVGDTPPTREQFDALQRRADLKAQELNNALTPLVNANTADSRQPATSYDANTIKYIPSLPTGWYLECTTAGVSGTGDIVLPSPIAENATVTDGTIVWTIRKIGSGGDGAAVGDIKAIAYNGTIQQGWLLCDGSAVSRTMYPDLFAAIGTTYGAGDGSTTFNVPDYNAAERFVQGSSTAGTVKSAGLPNIEGALDYSNYITKYSIFTHGQTGSSGAVSWKDIGNIPLNTAGSGFGVGSLGFDASKSNPIYGASNTVQPNALTARYIIKAFDGQTADSALIDITQYANELANKATRALDNLSADGENHFLEQDFTIIYPNGGSEASPANVTKNSTYVESNPFAGYYVECIVELLYAGEWADPLWMTDNNNSSQGTAVSQLNDDSIIVKTGLVNIASGPQYTGSALAVSNLQTAPCRVKVWKIGKIPTT